MASAWFYSAGGTQHGPVTSAELAELARSGKLRPTDKVWKEGMAEWQPAGGIKGLFAPLPPPPPPAEPPSVASAAKGLLDAVAGAAKRVGKKVEAAAKQPPPKADETAPEADEPEADSTPKPPGVPKVSRRTMIVAGSGCGALLLSCVVCAGIGSITGKKNPVIKNSVTGEGRLESFDDIPKDVQEAVKEKKTVWAVDGLGFIDLSDGTAGRKDATYLILQEGKLVSFVSKSNFMWRLDHMKDKSLKEYADASTYPAGEFAIGTGTKCRVKGNQTEEARIEVHFTFVTNMAEDAHGNIITGERTTTLILVWNKGGTKGSWDADENGWTQLQSRGKKFDPQPIAKTKKGSASRLSDDGYTFKLRTPKDK